MSSPDSQVFYFQPKKTPAHYAVPGAKQKNRYSSSCINKTKKKKNSSSPSESWWRFYFPLFSGISLVIHTRQTLVTREAPTWQTGEGDDEQHWIYIHQNAGSVSRNIRVSKCTNCSCWNLQFTSMFDFPPFLNQHVISFLIFKLNWMLNFVLTIVLFCIMTQLVAPTEGGWTKIYQRYKTPPK